MVNLSGENIGNNKSDQGSDNTRLTNNKNNYYFRNKKIRTNKKNNGYKKNKIKNRNRKNKNLFFTLLNYIAYLLNYLSVGIYFILKYIIIAFYRVGKLIYFGLKSIFNKRERKNKPFIKRKKGTGIKILDTKKGDFNKFWNKFKSSDSMIGLIIGARGSGKSAIALTIAEDFKESQKKIYSMGFTNLPRWIKNIDDIKELKNDSIIVIDESGILFSSRESMSNANKLLSELLFIARHKNISILFISQNSSNLEVNTLRQADFIILKKSSLLQENFERKIIAKIYQEHQDGFKKYKDFKGLALFYSDDFEGFINNDLPSFWSEDVSKSFK